MIDGLPTRMIMCMVWIGLLAAVFTILWVESL